MAEDAHPVRRLTDVIREKLLRLLRLGQGR